VVENSAFGTPALLLTLIASVTKVDKTVKACNSNVSTNVYFMIKIRYRVNHSKYFVYVPIFYFTTLHFLFDEALIFSFRAQLILFMLLVVFWAG